MSAIANQELDQMKTGVLRTKSDAATMSVPVNPLSMQAVLPFRWTPHLTPAKKED